MPNNARWLPAVLLIAAIEVSACGGSSTFNNAPVGNGAAARVERVRGASTVRIVLSALAARRLGIVTARIAREDRGRGGTAARTAIPYAAVVYGPDGNTFTFTSPSALVYVPRPVVVDYVTGSLAVLRSGPPVGTEVVTVGSAELLGAEYGVEEG